LGKDGLDQSTSRHFKTSHNANIMRSSVSYTTEITTQVTNSSNNKTLQ